MATVEGVVTVQLPSGLYRVELEGGSCVTVHAGAGGERNFVRVLVGSRVEIELMSRDVTRGRIVKVVSR